MPLKILANSGHGLGQRTCNAGHALFDRLHRDCWLDGLNDAAWSLVVHPAREAQYVRRAIQLAKQAVEAEPDKATYWNTLGIAHFRAKDWKASMQALKRSTEYNHGGTSFDYF